jgi:serine/threonine protein kinase
LWDINRTRESSLSELIGKDLGPYHILEQISSGGMSTVYKAYHAALDRYVAVKVLSEQMSLDSEIRQRFQQEVKVTAKLEHAHILPIYDYGHTESRLYLVVRYVDSGTLKDRLSEGKLDLSEVQRILHQVGEALAYAHHMGVVHRDVKPSNVLLDAQGDCFLTDFGLARIMEASTHLTATGVGMGTPAYMSPEQGKGEHVDTRSDIYSLGVMLYEMTTGQVPYQASTPVAVMLKHITEPVPPPSSVNPDLPDELENVILKATAKEPEERFQTVEEMLGALDAALDKLSGKTRPSIPMPPRQPDSTPSGNRRPRIRPWALGLGGGGLVGLVALIVLVLTNVLGVGWPVRDRSQPTATPSVEDVALAQTMTDTPLPTATATMLPIPTATSTATQTPTATATATRQPTYTPTSTATPAPTDTATPPPTRTSTPAPTPTYTPTSTPTETPRWLPAPLLIAPPYGDSYGGWNAVVHLKWSRVEGLAENEYYVVRIPYDDAGGVAEFWRKETLFQVPSNFSLAEVGFPDRHYEWTVQVMRCTQNCDRVLDDNTRKTGIAVGSESESGLFYWYPDVSGTPPKPTPTR